jgi:hypothetical protein
LGLVDPSGRALDSIAKVFAEVLVRLNEMFLDEVEVVCDIR